MRSIQISRSEWEAATGFDESENFTYDVTRDREYEAEEEWEEADGDDAIIRFSIEGNTLMVSAHGFGPSLASGNRLYQNDDGWCELNEWTISRQDCPEAFDAAKELARKH